MHLAPFKRLPRGMLADGRHQRPGGGLHGWTGPAAGPLRGIRRRHRRLSRRASRLCGAAYPRPHRRDSRRYLAVHRLHGQRRHRARPSRADHRDGPDRGRDRHHRLHRHEPPGRGSHAPCAVAHRRSSPRSATSPPRLGDASASTCPPESTAPPECGRRTSSSPGAACASSTSSTSVTTSPPCW